MLHPPRCQRDAPNRSMTMRPIVADSNAIAWCHRPAIDRLRAMQGWKRSDLVELLERLRDARDAVERGGNEPPHYVLLAIKEVEDELARRDAEGVR